MGTYIRLTDYKSSEEKEKGFFDPTNRYEAKQEDFEKIPGSPISYWISQNIYKLFKDTQKLGEIAAPRKGNTTTNNDKFLRQWYEVDCNKIALNFNSIKLANKKNKKWFPYNKGGGYRKWYGLNDSLINWENDGYEIRQIPHAVIANYHYYMKPGITWSTITTSKFGVRDFGKGYIFDNGGCCIFVKNEDKNFLSALLNSNTFTEVFSKINPTINFQSGEIAKFPILYPRNNKVKQKINQLTQECIDISKKEWDSRETSWDFRTNELIRIKNEELEVKSCKLEDAYNAYRNYWREKFFQLHANEEELNRLFIDIYGLQDELSPDVPMEEITILKNEAKIIDGELVFQVDEIMKQFISYAVGVMFGRYSLDHEGLHIADTGVSLQDAASKFGIEHPTFEADDDNIIPVVDEGDYFADDITDRFVEFLRITFGAEDLQRNIAFIEKALGKKLRKYFVKDFYKDHVQRYKKRPIYWLFSSPKGYFQVLIYMHRYTPDTLNNILNDYLRPFRVRLETMRNEALRLTEREDISAREKTAAQKRIEKIDKALADIDDYEKVLAHYAAQRIEIDLDDGVKVNYCKFNEVLFEFDKKLCKTK